MTNLATAILSLVFTAGPQTVRLSIDFPPAWQGTPLVLYSDGRRLEGPLSGERFVGAAALVKYEVSDRSGHRRKNGSIRERVVVLEQAAGLPDRPVFEKTVRFVGGTASDCQLFGYDESAVSESERAAARIQARGFFRRFRQELYLDSDAVPFAVLEWRHEVEGIRLLGAQGSR